MPAPLYAKTWSPTLNLLTPLPTDSISPESSVPRMGIRGLEKPKISSAKGPNPFGTLRVRALQSPAVTVVACTLIRTS